MLFRSATTTGEIDFWIGTATDIDDRKRIEEAQRFLLEAGGELGDVARLPADARGGRKAGRAADRRLVRGDIVEEDGTIRQLAVAHADPAKIVFARELQQRYPPDPEAHAARPR